MAYDSDKAYKSIELHYWLQEDLHNMDAFIQNRCEYEFLNLIDEIAQSLNAEISIETEPLAEGGLKRIYKLISKNEGKKALITIAVITAVATAIIVTPITASINKTIEIAIERAFEDEELKKMQNEKARLEIEKLKQDIKIDSIRLINNDRIKSSQNNFYLQLVNYSDIEKVSFALEDEKQNRISEEAFVEKVRFREFEPIELIRAIPKFPSFRAINDTSLIHTRSLSEQIIENVTIEIISPDFSDKSNKWKGFYNGKLISFKVTSDEFNKLVQSGAIQFKKGNTLKCSLIEIRDGSKTSYNVFSVSNY